MLLTLILLIPSVLSVALCAYLFAGLFIYLRSLYQTAPASPKLARVASASSAASIEIEAIPAT